METFLFLINPRSLMTYLLLVKKSNFIKSYLRLSYVTMKLVVQQLKYLQLVSSYYEFFIGMKNIFRHTYNILHL